MMKRITVILLLLCAFQGIAQTNAQLLKHYEAYYQQMKTQGDIHGVVSALTHLNILSPSIERRDTLAAIYMNDGSHVQALNTLGSAELKPTDSNLAIEVKAVCLEQLGELQGAIVHYEEIFKRQASIVVAYQLADLKIRVDDLAGAVTYIDYGMANATPEMKQTYYEQQMPYQVPYKASFLYLKSLSKFKENPQTNKDAAIAILDEALQVAPNFNLAQISKDAIIAQKQ